MPKKLIVILLAAVGLLLVVLSVLSATVFKPASTISMAAKPAEAETGVWLTSPGALRIISPEVTVKVTTEGDKKALLAVGHHQDVAAYAAALGSAKIIGASSWETLSTEYQAATGTDEEKKAALEADLLSSDLWLETANSVGELTFKYAAADDSKTLLIASEDLKTLPEVTLTWQRSVSTPLVVPAAVIGGLLVLLAGLLAGKWWLEHRTRERHRIKESVVDVVSSSLSSGVPEEVIAGETDISEILPTLTGAIPIVSATGTFEPATDTAAIRAVEPGTATGSLAALGLTRKQMREEAERLAREDKAAKKNKNRPATGAIPIVEVEEEVSDVPAAKLLDAEEVAKEWSARWDFKAEAQPASQTFDSLITPDVDAVASTAANTVWADSLITQPESVSEDTAAGESNSGGEVSSNGEGNTERPAEDGVAEVGKVAELGTAETVEPVIAAVAQEKTSNNDPVSEKLQRLKDQFANNDLATIWPEADAKAATASEEANEVEGEEK